MVMEAANGRAFDPAVACYPVAVVEASAARGRESHLRQSLVILRREFSLRVRLWNIDRLLMVWQHRLYPSLLDAIIILQPETAIRWHRRGFHAYWHWKRNKAALSHSFEGDTAPLEMISSTQPCSYSQGETPTCVLEQLM